MNYACWRRSTLSHAIFNSIALTCRLDRITKVTAVPVMSLVNTCLSGFFQSSISRAVQIWDVSIFRMLWGFTNCPGSPLVISVLPGPVPTRSRALLATHIMVDKRIPNISDRSVINQCGQYPVKKQQEAARTGCLWCLLFSFHQKIYTSRHARSMCMKRVSMAWGWGQVQFGVCGAFSQKKWSARPMDRNMVHFQVFMVHFHWKAIPSISKL